MAKHMVPGTSIENPEIGAPLNHPSILIGLSITNHPFSGTSIYGNPEIAILNFEPIKSYQIPFQAS